MKRPRQEVHLCCEILDEYLTRLSKNSCHFRLKDKAKKCWYSEIGGTILAQSVVIEKQTDTKKVGMKTNSSQL